MLACARYRCCRCRSLGLCCRVEKLWREGRECGDGGGGGGLGIGYCFRQLELLQVERMLSAGVEDGGVVLSSHGYRFCLVGLAGLSRGSGWLSWLSPWSVAAGIRRG